MNSSGSGVEFLAFAVRLMTILACVVFAIGWVLYWTLELAFGSKGNVIAFLFMFAGGAGTAVTITAMLLVRGSRLHRKVAWGVSGTWLLTLGLVMAVFGFYHDLVAIVFVSWFLHTLAAACFASSKRNPPAVSLDDCIHCGYDIRGLEGTTCPECGNHLNMRASSVKEA